MKVYLMYDKYDDTYKQVIDVTDLTKYIQDITTKIRNEKVEENFITASQAKLDTIIELDNLLEELRRDIDE